MIHNIYPFGALRRHIPTVVVVKRADYILQNGLVANGIITANCASDRGEILAKRVNL